MALLAMVLGCIRMFLEFTPRGFLNILICMFFKAILYIMLSEKTEIPIAIIIYIPIIIIDIFKSIIVLYIVRDGYITILDMDIVNMVITGKVLELLLFPIIICLASEVPILWVIENKTEWLLFGEIISSILVGMCYFVIYVIFGGW